MIFRPTHLERTPHPRPTHIAYVEWFDIKGRDSDIDMFYVQKAYNRQGRPQTDIVPLDSIVQPCPLAPQFGRIAAKLDPSPSNPINGTTCISNLTKFWINSFHSKATYQSIF